MQVKLDNYHDRGSLVGKEVLYINSDTGGNLRTGKVRRFSSDGTCVNISSNIDNWQFVQDITIVEVLGESQ